MGIEVLMWIFAIILAPFVLYALVRIASSAWYRSKLDFLKSILNIEKEVTENGIKGKGV